MQTKLSLYEKLHFFERVYRYRYRTERQQLSHLTSLDLIGSTVVDVGCNRGIYAYWLSKAVGPKGKIYAFEPQPELFHDLVRLKKWLDVENLVISESALSDNQGQQRLSRQRVGDGGAHIISGIDEDLEEGGPNSKPDSVETLSISTVTLDQFTRDWADDEPFDFIKIDVEGHEGAVLRGSLETLQRFRPKIQIELRVDAPNIEEVMTFLRDAGYEGWMFLDGERVSASKFKELPSKKFGFVGHRDFLFTSSR